MDFERALLKELSDTWALTPLEISLRQIVSSKHFPFPDVQGGAELLEGYLRKGDCVDIVTSLETRRLEYIGSFAINGGYHVCFSGNKGRFTLNFSNDTFPIVGVIPDLAFHPPLHERYTLGLYVSVCSEDSQIAGDGLEEMLFLRR